MRLDRPGGRGSAPDRTLGQVGVAASEFCLGHGPYLPSNNQRSSAANVSIERPMTSPASSSRQWDSP